MKILKIFAVFAALAAIGYFGSPYIPPMVSVKNLTPILSYNDTLQLSVTMTNYTPQPKEIYFNQGDNPEDITVYVDPSQQPAPQIVAKKDALSTLTLPPFSHQTVTKKFSLTESSSKTPDQVIPSNVGEIFLSHGTHNYIVSWGGYLSSQQLLTVE